MKAMPNFIKPNRFEQPEDTTIHHLSIYAKQKRFLRQLCQGDGMDLLR